VTRAEALTIAAVAARRHGVELLGVFPVSSDLRDKLPSGTWHEVRMKNRDVMWYAVLLWNESEPGDALRSEVVEVARQCAAGPPS
jgi:hypothetical protein